MDNVKLRQKHNYKRWADNCKNCTHFKGEKECVDELGNDVWANTCHVDADPYNDEQDVYVLHNPFGYCDSYERK